MAELHREFDGYFYRSNQSLHRSVPSGQVGSMGPKKTPARRRRHVPLAWALFSACLAWRCASFEKTGSFRGAVNIYGNEPHTYAGIEAENGRIYAVYPPEKEAELRQLQGRVVEFTVRFLEKPKGYGSLFLTDGTVTPVSLKIID